MTNPVGFGKADENSGTILTALKLTGEDISDMGETLNTLNGLKTDTGVEILSGNFLTAQGVNFQVSPGEGEYEVRVTE